MTHPVPLILPFDGVEPRFAAPPLHCGAGSCVIGRTEIGARAWIGNDVIVRGDGNHIRIGDDAWLGRAATVHIAHERYPTFVGDRVTVGRNSVVHACTVGDGCVIEEDAVVLDGSTVEAGAVIERGSTVFGRTNVAGGLLHAGCPAKPVRALEPGEREARARRLREETPEAGENGREAQDHAAFVALTARLSGAIELGEGAGVYFGCVLRAGSGRIAVGANANVQDNTVIEATAHGVAIGQGVTIGHNVHLQDCRVGDRTLIGMGSVVRRGAVVEADVLLGAGAVAEAGQVLESGWLWGGRPARPIARLDEAKRALIARTEAQYCGYSRIYRQAQRELRS